MKNKQLVLEHSNMMYFSREIMELRVPKELEFVFYTVICLVLITFGLLSYMKVNDVVKANGIVKTQMNNSCVKNVISGQINEIFYGPDQFVEKDEVLYTLKDDLFVSLKADLLNRMELNEKKLTCTDKLMESFYAEKNLVSGKDVFVYSQLDEYLKTVAYKESQIELLKYQYEVEKKKPEVMVNPQKVYEAFMNYQLSVEELDKYKASFLADVVQRKVELESEREQLSQEMRRLEEQYLFLVVKAPVSGFVQEISSLNTGDYIFSDQSVMNIIPNDEKNFRIQLNVPTKDIREISPGMEVKLRLSAFPFFEYKGAVGKVTAIDSDVRQSSNGGLYYCVYCDIDRTEFEGKKNISYPLRPGIEVNARIVLEKVTVMNFILRKLDFA